MKSGSLYPLNKKLPIPLSSHPLANTILLSVFMNLTILGILYMFNYTALIFCD